VIWECETKDPERLVPGLREFVGRPSVRLGRNERKLR
jgi:hypothetical protein